MESCRVSPSPSELQECFSWPIDNGTLRSTLVNLVHTKHTVRKQQRKAFYYSARLPKTAALQAMMRGLARIFAQGSTRVFVAQLVETKDITPEDLQVIRAAAAAKPAPKSKADRP